MRVEMQMPRLPASFSIAGVVLLVAFCSAQRVAPSQFPTIRPPSNPSQKTPGRVVMHPAFANAGRVPGLQIWRIENFEPVAYPQDKFGKFYTGDSYIVLNTIKDKNNKFSWDVHFWLGSETSQDEAGAAAILTVQLDDILNGEPVQHREVQDHESNLFISYFRNGVRYENGGVGTGFRHVQTNAAGEKRLFHVKGKRNVRVRQVNLSVSSMNKGDCFILDAGNDIYVYVGAGAKRVEKLKATSVANQIRDQDHHGRARVHIVDEFSPDTEKQLFFTVLGSGSPNEVPDESVAEDDQAFESNEERIVTLYKVSDASGSLKVDTVARKPLSQDLLDTNECFILDTGSGIFVWVGKRATQTEKTQSLLRAQEFLTSKKYPAWTQVHRIVESAESAPFKQYFATWRDHGMAHNRLIRSINEQLDDSAIQSLKKSGGCALGFMPDDASGKIRKILKYKNGKTYELSVDNNILVADAVYYIEYDFELENGEKGIVLYNWVGKNFHDLDKLELEETNFPSDHTNTMWVRVAQGHEPRHFRKIFKGKLLTSFAEDNKKTSIYRVRGISENDVISEELALSAVSLASDDAFLVRSPNKNYVWIGKGAAEFEKQIAADIVKSMAEQFLTVDEGDESEEFWNLLSGKGDYDKTIGAIGAPLLEPRLFHCKIRANRRFRFEELENFKQDDLDMDDVMLLDGGDEVYIWIGSGSSEIERRKANAMAKEYIHNDHTDRSEDTTTLIKLEQGQEPECFKKIFPSWDDNYWKSLPTFEDVLNEIAKENSKLGDI